MVKRKSFTEWMETNDLVLLENYAYATAVVLDVKPVKLKHTDSSWDWTKHIKAIKFIDPNVWTDYQYNDESDLFGGIRSKLWQNKYPGKIAVNHTQKDVKEFLRDQDVAFPKPKEAESQACAVEPVAYRWTKGRISSIGGAHNTVVRDKSRSQHCSLCNGTGTFDRNLMADTESQDKNKAQAYKDRARRMEELEKLRQAASEKNKAAISAAKTEWYKYLEKRENFQYTEATKKKPTPKKPSNALEPELAAILNDPLIYSPEEAAEIKKLTIDQQKEILGWQLRSKEVGEKKKLSGTSEPSRFDPKTRELLATIVNPSDERRTYPTESPQMHCDTCKDTGVMNKQLCPDCDICPMCKGSGRSNAEWKWHWSSLGDCGTTVPPKYAIKMELNKVPVKPLKPDIFWMEYEGHTPSSPQKSKLGEKQPDLYSDAAPGEAIGRAHPSMWDKYDAEAKEQTAKDVLVCPLGHQEETEDYILNSGKPCPVCTKQNIVYCPTCAKQGIKTTDIRADKSQKCPRHPRLNLATPKMEVRPRTTAYPVLRDPEDIETLNQAYTISNGYIMKREGGEGHPRDRHRNREDIEFRNTRFSDPKDMSPPAFRPLSQFQRFTKTHTANISPNIDPTGLPQYICPKCEDKLKEFETGQSKRKTEPRSPIVHVVDTGNNIIKILTSEKAGKKIKGVEDKRKTFLPTTFQKAGKEGMRLRGLEAEIGVTPEEIEELESAKQTGPTLKQGVECNHEFVTEDDFYRVGKTVQKAIIKYLAEKGTSNSRLAPRVAKPAPIKTGTQFPPSAVSILSGQPEPEETKADMQDIPGASTGQLSPTGIGSTLTGGGQVEPREND